MTIFHKEPQTDHLFVALYEKYSPLAISKNLGYTF